MRYVLESKINTGSCNPVRTYTELRAHQVKELKDGIIINAPPPKKKIQKTNIQILFYRTILV